MSGVIITTPERQTIRQRVSKDYVLSDLDSCGMTLGTVLAEVTELIAKHGEAAILTTDVCGSCQTCESDLDEVELASRVWVERPENDAEQEQRLKVEKIRADRREVDERRTYEILRARFEVKP